MRIVAEVLDVANPAQAGQQTVVEMTNSTGEYEQSATVYANFGHVYDYDGVAMMPAEALEALRKAGYHTEEIE